MADSWRLARSLVVLRDEIRSLHPGTTVWTIGDQAHRSTWSDHNPTSSGVVCAIDVLGDKGLNLGAFAEHLKRTNHRAVKYVIFNRRIWSKSRSGEGWRPYSGSNPHTTHVHVSVGVGPDGRSTGPYDDTSPWGVARTGGGSIPSLPSTGLVPDPPLRENDTGPRVGHLQRSLNEALSLKLAVDDVFGPATKSGVLLLQRTAGITQDGIYGPDSARALTDLLEDDMQADDRIPFPEWGQRQWDGLGNTILVRTALASGYAHSREAKDRAKQIQAELAAARKRDEAILQAVKGVDTKAILDAIERAAVEDAARDTAAADALAEIASLVAKVGSGQLAADAVVDLIAERLSPAGGE